MSNTDPDLKPTEGNLPVAIDVVDGELIVKRYDGSEESFPLGGGSGDVSFQSAPGYFTGNFEQTTLEPVSLENSTTSLPFSGVVAYQPGRAPYDYSTEEIVYDFSGGTPSENVLFENGWLLGTDGLLAMAEVGLYFYEVFLAFAQGEGDTGDPTVGNAWGGVVWEHGAPFINPSSPYNEMSMKTASGLGMVISGLIAVQDVMLQPITEIIVVVGHSSTGTLTVTGSITSWRVT
jgi:hypothetical protein